MNSISNSKVKRQNLYHSYQFIQNHKKKMLAKMKFQYSKSIKSGVEIFVLVFLESINVKLGSQRANMK